MLYQVLHDHRFGTSAYLIRSPHKPSVDEAVAALDLDCDLDRDDEDIQIVPGTADATIGGDHDPEADPYLSFVRQVASLPTEDDAEYEPEGNDEQVAALYVLIATARELLAD